MKFAFLRAASKHLFPGGCKDVGTTRDLLQLHREPLQKHRLVWQFQSHHRMPTVETYTLVMDGHGGFDTDAVTHSARRSPVLHELQTKDAQENSSGEYIPSPEYTGSYTN